MSCRTALLAFCCLLATPTLALTEEAPAPARPLQPIVPSPPSTPSTSWLKHLQRCAARITSLKATFSLERIEKMHSRQPAQTGIIQLRRGGLIRMSWDTPPRLFVSDGRNAWAYDKSERTVFVSEVGENPLRAFSDWLLSAQGTQPAEAHLLDGPPAPIASGGDAAIEIVPAVASEFYSSVILTVAPRCPAIRRVSLVETNGAVTRITLSEIEVNPGAGPSLFRFIAPKGTNVVHP